MLVLTRKIGEQVVIPTFHLTVTILEVQGDKVRIGITAPSHVHIQRQEIWARNQAVKNAVPPQVER